MILSINEFFKFSTVFRLYIDAYLFLLRQPNCLISNDMWYLSLTIVCIIFIIKSLASHRMLLISRVLGKYCNLLGWTLTYKPLCFIDPFLDIYLITMPGPHNFFSLISLKIYKTSIGKVHWHASAYVVS